MGNMCGPQKVKDQIYFENAVIAQWKTQFEALKLKDIDVEKLYEVYTKIDQDGSGSISLWEMLEHLQLQRNKFTKRVFSIMDEDNSGEIDFREFVIALWNYCTLGKAALILFAFDLYDNDNSGKIDIDEIKLMLREVYGKDVDNSQQAQMVMGKIQKYSESKAEEEINKEEFSDFVRRNPALLYPAFQLQMTLQKKTMGLAFWEQLASTRVELSEGNFISVTALLQVQISKTAFDSLIEIDDAAPNAGNKLQKFYHAEDGKGSTDAFHAMEKHTATNNAGTVADRRSKNNIVVVKAARNAAAVSAFGEAGKKGEARRKSSAANDLKAGHGHEVQLKASGDKHEGGGEKKKGKGRRQTAASKVAAHYANKPHEGPGVAAMEGTGHMSYDAYKDAKAAAEGGGHGKKKGKATIKGKLRNAAKVAADDPNAALDSMGHMVHAPSRAHAKANY